MEEYLTDILGWHHLISDVEAASFEYPSFCMAKAPDCATINALRFCMHSNVWIPPSARTNGGKTATFEGELVLYELLYNGDCDSTGDWLARLTVTKS